MRQGQEGTGTLAHGLCCLGGGFLSHGCTHAVPSFCWLGTGYDSRLWGRLRSGEFVCRPWPLHNGGIPDRERSVRASIRQARDERRGGGLRHAASGRQPIGGCDVRRERRSRDHAGRAHGCANLGFGHQRSRDRGLSRHRRDRQRLVKQRSAIGIAIPSGSFASPAEVRAIRAGRHSGPLTKCGPAGSGHS